MQLAPVNVTSTQIERPVFDTPASVDLIDGAAMRSHRMQVNLSESLAGVPGLLIQDRENFAQDLRIVIRGFGARSSFGVRGLRLYVDGIPATMPDGQGQTSNIDIASIDRVEILRGPFSALYGNSSGGVLQVFTEQGNGALKITPSFGAGSNGQRRVGLKASGSTGQGPGAIDYLLSTSRYTTDGYRDHSAASKNLANAKLGLALDERSRLTLVLNGVNIKADDPQGLTYAEFLDRPRSAAPNALLFNTRKNVRQHQGGLVYERQIDAAHALRLMAYYGQRDTLQFQAIPVSTQAAPGHAGGVIDLGRSYAGFDARWSAQLALAERPLTVIAGLAYDRLAEDRRGYENFIGTGSAARLGVRGDLRREERNTVWNIDPYLQASWDFAERWTLDAGMRYSSVRFDSDDRYIKAGNADDSGAARYRKALPMAALRFQARSNLNLYATAGRGFETPTFNEVSYRPDQLPGLNFDLQPSTNDSIEIGAKARVGASLITAALFQTRTDNEIVNANAQGGRSTYRNARRTRRDGLELSWTGEVARDWHGALAYTWLDAKYRDSFHDGAAIPENLIPAGNRLPGIAKQALFAALDWAPPQGWRAGMEARFLSKFHVNDRNDAAAPGYFTAAAHGGYLWRLEGWEINAFARVDNLFDRRHAGSAIVNVAFGRYYEPAPGRNWIMGISASHLF